MVNSHTFRYRISLEYKIPNWKKDFNRLLAPTCVDSVIIFKQICDPGPQNQS